MAGQIRMSIGTDGLFSMIYKSYATKLYAHSKIRGVYSYGLPRVPRTLAMTRGWIIFQYFGCVLVMVNIVFASFSYALAITRGWVYESNFRALNLTPTQKWCKIYESCIINQLRHSGDNGVGDCGLPRVLRTLAMTKSIVASFSYALAMTKGWVYESNFRALNLMPAQKWCKIYESYIMNQLRHSGDNRLGDYGLPRVLRTLAMTKGWVYESNSQFWRVRSMGHKIHKSCMMPIQCA